MIKKESHNVSRLARHARVRKKVSGTAETPRLCVFRSLKNIYAQVIDDVSGNTLAAASSLDADLKGSYGGNKDAARKVGKALGKFAAEKGISEAVFDRGGYLYHGRVRELAEGAREGGLQF